MGDLKRQLRTLPYNFDTARVTFRSETSDGMLEEVGDDTRLVQHLAERSGMVILEGKKSATPSIAPQVP